jgi:hypothetical protein
MPVLPSSSQYCSGLQSRPLCSASLRNLKPTWPFIRLIGFSHPLSFPWFRTVKICSTGGGVSPVIFSNGLTVVDQAYSQFSFGRWPVRLPLIDIFRHEWVIPFLNRFVLGMRSFSRFLVKKSMTLCNVSRKFGMNNQRLLLSTSELAALIEGESNSGIHNWRNPQLATFTIEGTQNWQHPQPAASRKGGIQRRRHP